MTDKNRTGKPRPVPPEIEEIQDEVAFNKGEEYTTEDFLAAVDRVKRPRTD